jgi:hypothetical protein
VLPNRATAVELSPASHIVTIPSFLSPPPPLTSTTTTRGHRRRRRAPQPLPTFGPSWGGLVDTATPLRRRHVTVERTPPNAAASPKRHPSTTPHHGSQRRRRSRPMAPRHCPPNDIDEAAQWCHVTGPNDADKAPNDADKAPNDATSRHGSKFDTTKGAGAKGSGGRDGEGRGGGCPGQRGGVHPTRRLVSCLFFSSTGAVCTLHAACFFFRRFFPREIPLLRDKRGSVHPTRCLVCFLFFRQRGSVHLARCLVFIRSFPPPPSCENNDEAACIPHAASLPIFFLFDDAVCGVVHRGRRETHTPAPFEFVCPSLGGITPAAALSKGGGVQPTRRPLLLCLPPLLGGVLFVVGATLNLINIFAKLKIN